MTVFVVWLAALGLTIFCDQIRPVLDRAHISSGWASFVGFLSAMLLVALTLYGMALAARWLLRHLFWRVGRRLFLSYVMIGIFPFFLFAILLMAIVYMIGGVMSHAALRGERQASLGQLEAAAQEYSLRGEKPPDALPTLEIYDSADDSAAKLPAWLRRKTFSGLVARGKESLLVAARQVANEDGGPSRTVVFVQPIDRAWVDALYEKDGMIVRMGHEDRRGDVEEARPRDGSLHVEVGGQDGTPVKMKRGGTKLNFDDGDIGERVVRALWPPFRNIVWADVASLTDWNTGNEGDGRQLATLIINPSRNLFHFYFGASSDRYLSILVQVILGLTITLLCVYFLAALFAGMLIFSITRAVNRIEKGTKAVERGDFSYRIGMKPNNQLGEMARSFDRMTESIASLLVNVAENERLQSEIAIAATIQRNLLPKEGPRFRGVSFSAHFEPTASIGGDYYDVFNIDKSRLAVAIGDVSGHGLSTGLVMAMVKAAITTLVEEGADEVSLFHRLNDLVFRSTERRAFMTLAFTIFDLEKGTIRHTNAGHLYPYLLRNGQPPVAIEVPSLPLGVRADVTTRTAETELQEGDAIVYLSDGIVEAQDPNGEPFGFEQLEALLDAGNDRSPNGIRDAILQAVARHSGTRAADDDRTVMVIRFDSLLSVMKPVDAEALVPASALA